MYRLHIVVYTNNVIDYGQGQNQPAQSSLHSCVVSVLFAGFSSYVGIFPHVNSDQSKSSLGNTSWPMSDVDVVM